MTSVHYLRILQEGPNGLVEGCRIFLVGQMARVRDHSELRPRHQPRKLARKTRRSDGVMLADQDQGWNGDRAGHVAHIYAPKFGRCGPIHRLVEGGECFDAALDERRRWARAVERPPPEPGQAPP